MSRFFGGLPPPPPRNDGVEMYGKIVPTETLRRIDDTAKKFADMLKATTLDKRDDFDPSRHPEFIKTLESAFGRPAETFLRDYTSVVYGEATREREAKFLYHAIASDSYRLQTIIQFGLITDPNFSERFQQSLCDLQQAQTHSLGFSKLSEIQRENVQVELKRANVLANLFEEHGTLFPQTVRGSRGYSMERTIEPPQKPYSRFLSVDSKYGPVKISFHSNPDLTTRYYTIGFNTDVPHADRYWIPISPDGQIGEAATRLNEKTKLSRNLPKRDTLVDAVIREIESGAKIDRFGGGYNKRFFEES